MDRLTDETGTDILFLLRDRFLDLVSWVRFCSSAKLYIQYKSNRLPNWLIYESLPWEDTVRKHGYWLTMIHQLASIGWPRLKPKHVNVFKKTQRLSMKWVDSATRSGYTMDFCVGQKIAAHWHQCSGIAVCNCWSINRERGEIHTQPDRHSKIAALIGVTHKH